MDEPSQPRPRPAWQRCLLACLLLVVVVVALIVGLLALGLLKVNAWAAERGRALVELEARLRAAEEPLLRVSDSRVTLDHERLALYLETRARMARNAAEGVRLVAKPLTTDPAKIRAWADLACAHWQLLAASQMSRVERSAITETLYVRAPGANDAETQALLEANRARIDELADPVLDQLLEAPSGEILATARGPSYGGGGGGRSGGGHHFDFDD